MKPKFNFLDIRTADRAEKDTAAKQRRPGIARIVAEVRTKNPGLPDVQILAQAKQLWTQRKLRGGRND